MRGVRLEIYRADRDIEDGVPTFAFQVAWMMDDNPYMAAKVGDNWLKSETFSGGSFRSTYAALSAAMDGLRRACEDLQQSEAKHYPIRDSVDDLRIPLWQIARLKRAGITKITQVAALSDKDLGCISGIGKKAKRDIRKALAESDLRALQGARE